MLKKNLLIFIKSILGLFILTSGFTSLYYLFNESEKVKLFVEKNTVIQQSKKDDKKWANEILKGGYILFFRHAERDKWIDVSVYDALETNVPNIGGKGLRYGEKEYFGKAVCLNKRGKIQAQAMNEVIEHSGLPTGYIVSSPSCRARQTAELAFGGYDKLDYNFLHKSPFLVDLSKKNNFLEKHILNLPIEKGSNTIISSHNPKSVIDCSYFTNKNCDFKLGEGGFLVIKKDNNKLDLVYKFYNFKTYSRVFFPIDY